MAGYDIRQDKPYRRGLILGLTIAEIMILLIFVLLMALASALANRDRRLAALQDGVGSRLVEVLQRAYPQATSSDDFYKELVRAVEARKILEQSNVEGRPELLVEDAVLGRKARDAAAEVGARDPYEFVSNAVAKASMGKKGEWPPFFSLSEAGGYYFESGKATLRADFVEKLDTTIIPLLKRYIDDYEVDVVEVTGHTDEVPMSGRSNLDTLLIAASQSRVPTESLRSTDNAGLAMARAVAVVRILRADTRLKGVTILPLSGAQLIVPIDRAADGKSTKDDQSRRRIEMRLRRSTEQVARTE
jgi:outer membrane protein OmpA-like peptidoglycan-associated protein